MWKKKFHRSSPFSTIISRASTSTESSSSIPISSRYSSSISNSRSIFSSSSLAKLEGEYFPSALGFLQSPISLIRRDNGSLFVKNESFFCSLSKSADKFQCWNCGAEAEDTTSFLFCHACRSVQPVNQSTNYFQIFGLNDKLSDCFDRGRDYKVQVEELEKKYKDWQKKLHPDLVHSKTKREREYAAEQSARVIDAYRTLSDPLSRAIYIVKLEGVPVDEEERITDPELLAEVMELREAVDEAEDAEALKKIQSELQDKLVYWSNSFEDAYLSKNYDDALASIRRMTYYKRANEEIVKKL